MFGGTVNLKYISSIFCGDDAIDTDLGYKGDIQFAFAAVGEDGHHAVEMDGNNDDNSRSFPRVYNAMFVGHTEGSVQSVSTDSVTQGVMMLREGTGGEFGNIVVTNVAN